MIALMEAPPSNRPAPFELATILPGALAFNEDNVNQTFRGQVLISGGRVRDAIIKDLDATQLTNELLASALAKASGLATPDAYLGLVRGGDLPISRGPLLADGNRLAFVSADVKVPNVTFQIKGATSLAAKKAVVSRVIAWADLGGLFAFDAWIANTDRHPGNLLLSALGEVWLIDHGHSFTGPAWEPSDLAPNRNYPNRLAEWITPEMDRSQRDQRASEASEVANALGNADIPSARSASKIDTLRGSAHGAAIELFLRGRATVARDHAMRALGFLV